METLIEILFYLVFGSMIAVGYFSGNVVLMMVGVILTVVMALENN